MKKLLFALFLITSVRGVTHAAISVSMVWEVNSNASDANGGAWKAGSTGTDWTYTSTGSILTPHVIFDGATITASTNVTSASIIITGYAVSTGDVGNILNQTTGTVNWVGGRFEIISVDTTTMRWTLDRNITTGNATGMQGRMGGALATPVCLSTAMAASNLAWVTGSYTSTQTITFAQAVSGGTPQNNVMRTKFKGYSTVRGDNGQFTITSASASTRGLFSSGAGMEFDNVTVDCNNQTSSQGIRFSANYGILNNFVVKNCTLVGVLVENGGSRYQIFDGEITGMTAGVVGQGAIGILGGNTEVFGVWIHDNACEGINQNNAGANNYLHDNVITNLTGASSDGIQFQNTTKIEFNTIYKVGRHGINNTQVYELNSTYQNNVITEAAGFCIQGASAAGLPADPRYDGNALYLCTSGPRNNMDDTGSTNAINGSTPYVNVSDVLLSADPFVNKAANDFRLNNTPGGGAACRARGIPRTWMNNSTTISFRDMGAVQHIDDGKLNIFYNSTLIGTVVN